jgi:Subtilase family/Divergent InlB B-repeat domain/Right handed beta helix region
MMNRNILIGLVVLLAANSLLLADQPYKPGVVLVRFAKGLDANEPNTTAKNAILNSALGRSGSSIRRNYTLVPGLTHVSLPTGMSVENAVTSLKKSSSVLYAEPDYQLQRFVIPNDTRFGELWGLHNTGQSGGTPGADISAPAAWDINTGSSKVIVAVTDTGVDYTHPDLAANMWSDTDGTHGYDFGDNDNNPMDDSADANHGTHVAGIIGAVGNNNTGVVGVCWHVRIMAVKIADSNGNMYLSSAVAGIEYAVAKGAKVINASWGLSGGYSQDLYEAIAAAQDAGVIFVAAAGNALNNNDLNPSYPASYDLGNIISVMATSNTDHQAFYSNYGLTSVDLGAPGGEWYFEYDPRSILSTLPGNQYQFFQGTSMASPYVAGACALVLSIDPNLTYSQVKQILVDTVDPTLPGLCKSGGRLNLAAAAQEAKTDTTPPTPSTPVWDIEPNATGWHTVTMRAMTETDRSGVEYYFECVNDVSKNSGWEPNTLYSFTNLSSGTTYGFHFKARDKSAQHNQTGWSTTISTTTSTGTNDTRPPVASPPRWAVNPRLLRAGSPTSQISMQAETAYDESGVEYYFEETTTTPHLNSGWQSSSTWITTAAFTVGNPYNFHFHVRDKSPAHNTTSWSANAGWTLGAVTTPQTRKVPSVYTTIQSAINVSSPGDTVEVSPGTYTGPGNYNISFRGLAITVKSVSPDNPDTVAATIIDCQGTANPFDQRRAFKFNTHEGPGSVLDGLTIRDGYVKGLPGNDGFDGTFGDPHALNGSDGSSGYDANAGAILCESASPIIRNCVIENCIAEGGDGGNGGNGADGNDYKAADPCATPPTSSQPSTPGGNGGNGGNSGVAYGGGIFADYGSSPKIQNCTIQGCMVQPGTAGNGGNGGNGGKTSSGGQERGGNAGDGGDVHDIFGGGIASITDISNGPLIIGCNIEGCNAFNFNLPGQEGAPGAGSPVGSTGSSGDIGKAGGGGIYDDISCPISISSTNVSGNMADSLEGGQGGGFCGRSENSKTITMSDCNFTENMAGIYYYSVLSDGGGIYLYGDPSTDDNLVLRNCHIMNNFAEIDGGGAYVENVDTAIYDSTVSGNYAGYGGGICLINVEPVTNLALTAQDCNFLDNFAQEGGAAFIYECSNINISSSQITGNSVSSQGLGGGLALWDSWGQITNCLINSNSSGGSGGAAYMEDYAAFQLQFINCLITDNSAVYDGGGLSNKSRAWTQLINCTLVNNSTTDGVHGSGGGVSCAEDDGYVEIYNSILWDNYSAYGSQIGVGTKYGSLGDPSANVAVYYSDIEGGEDAVYVNDPVTGAVWWMDGSFNADPLFANIAVNQPAYYLSQKAAGQLNDSPCVDTGDYISIGTLETYVGAPLTTRTDMVEDTGIIDIGYHYEVASVGAGKYPLAIEVNVYDPNEGGHGRLEAKTTPQSATQFDINDPNTILVNQGTVVNLTAFADPGYKVQSWSGTDDDNSTAATNTVTMNSSRSVIVTFEPDGLYYLTITQIGNGTVTPPVGRTLRAPGVVVPLTAMPANPTDVVIWTGTDNDNTDGQTNTVTMTGNRNVTVKFYTPKILHVGGSSGYSTIQAAIDDANDRDIIILMPADQPYYTQTGYQLIGRNLTITSINPDDPAVVASTVIQQQTGPGSGVSPAFLFENVGPLMRLWGITIRGFYVGGLPGFDGDPTRWGYDGWIGGDVEGMGIFCYDNASPTIENCVIDGCHTTGGHGGNGAAGDTTHPNAGNGGWPGWAWGGALFCYDNSNPTLINCTFSNNSATGGDAGDGGNGNNATGDYGSGGRGGGWHYGVNDQPPSPWEIGESYEGGEPKDYSGLGGAAYIGSGCYPTFKDCNFINNSSSGGLNGICGQTPTANLRAEPTIRYKIPNLGGAVYLAEGSFADFNNCTFTANNADTNELPASFDGILGFGGAIAADSYATPTISNCHFINNTSNVGGGVYSTLSYSEVNNCGFFANTATHGGGLLFSDSVAYITGSTFSGNVGNISGSDGGAIGLLGSNAEVADCNIVSNQTGGSGGGIYISSVNVDGNEIEGENSVLVKNCLITGNTADLDGGGISANWYSDPNIVNCTIVNNDANTGGGLFSSYGSDVNVLNCIIWDNQVGIGSSGSQIAVGGGDLPSAIQVLYSDVQDSNDPCATNDINTLDFVICFDTTGSMGADIDAVKTAARQITNAIAARFASYRLALVDFRDYPDGNHGALGDWAYRDRVKFTTDANQLINGLQPMAAGGGADGPEAIYTALMHSIDANALVARLTANGYTNYIDPNSPGLGNWRQGRRVMRVILVLTDAPPHDPEPYTNYVLNDIVTAATGSNPIHIIPVVIRGDPTAENALRPVAVGTGGILIQATDDNAVPGAVLNAIALLSHIPAPILVETGGAINWDPNTFTWGLNSHNINADPLFVGGYFLSQIAAGQLINSPCVDTGSEDVNSPDINLGGYTTRTDGVNDVNIVDMGYHYSRLFAVPKFMLNFTAIEVNGLLPAQQPRIIEPNSGPFNWYENVHLEVNTPPNGYDVLWTGTDNDDSNDVTNTVLMDRDRTVTVTYIKNICNLTVVVVGNRGGAVTVTPAGGIYHRGTVVQLVADPCAGYRLESWQGTDNDGLFTWNNTVTMNSDVNVMVTFSLPQTRTVPGDFTTIQAAVNAAHSGDIIIVATGVYNTPNLVINKELTVASTNPDDPGVVAMTIIDGNGMASTGVYFGANATGQTVFDGITIANCGYGRPDALDGANPGDNGGDGLTSSGAGIIVGGGASPKIRNCVIRNCNIYGGKAGNGANADATTNAGHGGWGGAARGAGIYVYPNANPTFENCTVTNCSVTGGSGGNGGNYAAAGGDAGYGGNWSDGLLWQTWGYEKDYRWYSGYGGGVFCDANSEANFIDCNITNNIARGGMSGIGGSRATGIQIPMPGTSYRIPSFGGGVYCAENSEVNFVGCTISNNVTPRPDFTYHTDPYLGHGGGIAFEDTASMRLQNCTISDNNSAVGGGMFWAGGSPEVLNCNLLNNVAYIGGGIYATESSGQIKGCTLRNNFAGVSPNDVDLVAGQGGGIFGSSMDTVIADCFLANNISSTSGGGIYIYGFGNTDTKIKNCLLTDNRADRDGGAISANWFSDTNIINCTIANNASAIGGTDTGFGGGVYCSYDSYVNILNSIIWDNLGTAGAQLSVGTGFEFSQWPSIANVSYSIIGPYGDVNKVTVQPAPALTINVTNDANVLASTILGPGINVVGQPQYIGANAASGTFAGGLAAGIGIESGIILTTGDANNALPPNNSDGASTDNNLPGDPDLNALLSDVNTYDAAVLEFTFTTSGGDLFFNFVFASEEYNEFVNTQYNDVFGFFLDGVNIALIPGTTTPVAINNVNGGNPFGTNASNPNLFHNNDLSDGGPFYAIQYDGFTNVFTAQALKVGSGTHTIKLAIADTADHALDSAVFIQAGSFSDKQSYSNPIYVGEGCTLIGWDANVSDPNKWDPNFVGYGNKNEDPLFIDGYFLNENPLFDDGYFLSQIAAGQLFNSPCWNAGSADVNSPGINLGGYTTRTDSVNDVNIVDMGYHYPLFTAHQYSLTIEVNGVGGGLTALGGGDSSFTIVAPNTRLVNADTVVSLQALADANYGILSWTGTDNDDINGVNNTVTMNSDKVVKVQFNQYRLTIEVMGPNGLDPNGYLVATGTGVNPFTISARQNPSSFVVAPGRVVNLEAFPDPNFRVRLWMNTDNDACTTRTNTVTMNSDKTAIVGFEPNGLYYLTVSVKGNGTVTHLGRELHTPGDVVTLDATPANPSDAIIWTGTDDIYSTARQNTVTMNGHRDVTVEFYTPRVLYVGTDTGYPTIQFAIDDANDRDIVMITPGTYNIYESSKDHPYLYISGKAIRLTSTNPEDANATQIIGGFVIDDANRNLIIEGLTIRDAIYWKDYENGNGIIGEQNPFAEHSYDPAPTGTGTDGYGGGTCRGAGMQLNGTASPTVRNCLFVNCVARGIHGQTGAGGTGVDGWSGNGGPGGKAFGGGAYCGQGGSPLFENCSFINCSAQAGDAGNGGAAAPNPGGHGGAWGDMNAVWWDEWRALYGAIHPLEAYWKYSGYGGAIYCDVNNTAEFMNCTFTGNSVLGSSCGISGPSVPSGWPTQHYKIESFGGAVYAASGSAPQFVECNFTDNEANMQGPPTSRKDNTATVNAYPNVSFGGAVAFEDGARPVFEKCTFNSNRATIGGGAFAAWAYGTVTDCNFEDNSSYSGGGILYVGGTSEIINSRFTGNQSTVSASQGGAITLLGANAEVRDCNIWANASAGSGGGIYISSQDAEGSELAGGNSVLIKNCLITGNSAGQNGAGISAVWYSDPNIVNCTIADNNAQGMGGGLYSAYNNYTNIINSIFWDNNAPQGPQIAIGTTDNPADVKVAYSDIEGGVAAVYHAPLTTLEWDVVSSDPNYPTNINSDPLFFNGYFLSQIGAGQISDSCCVNAGSADVNRPDINLGGYTTRTDSNTDTGIVDMGYHYSTFTPPQYHLTVIPGDGLTLSDVTPSDGNYVWFSKVPLHVSATPPNGYQIVWTGTDNNDINDGNNSVRMTGDRTVTVGFGKNICNLIVEVVDNRGGTFTVSPPSADGNYTRGATVTVTAIPDAGYRVEGWGGGTADDTSFARTNTVVMDRDKTVMVTFSLPRTVTVPGDYTTIQEAIDGTSSGDRIVVSSGVYHVTSTNGLVINKDIAITSTNPDDPCVVAATIIDLSYGEHRVHFGASVGPAAVFDGFTLTSGSYSAQGRLDGAIGQDGLDGFGLAGGVVVVESYAKPTIRNCVIRDTTITGGNASNGGSSDATNNAGRGGWAGWARGGGIYIAPFANPTLINCAITNCTVVGGNGGNGGNYTLGGGNAGYGGNWSDGLLWRTWGYENDYRWYSGYGGGVFCDANSEANFIDCNIINNTARGGLSGTGGAGPAGPVDPCIPYRIPSYGGGIYCAENSDINLLGCIISNNVTPRPDGTYHIDPYLGHGGGIAFENTANIRLQNCTISNNSSAVGGGVFWAGGEPEVLDCSIMRNTAYLGGGIYAMESAGQIRGCTLLNNFAGISTGDVDVIAGQGGGIFGSSIDTVIADCLVTDNNSSTSGGGIHIYGPGGADPIIRNCLLTGNIAGRDGGGISANWGAVVSVENCTIYNNQAIGTFGEPGNTGFGGGLYCSYEAQTSVRNSIIWDNNGLFGNEIAETTGFEHEQLCGTVSVSYSDIRGGQAGVYISPGCPNDWSGLGNINTDPCFVNAAGDDFHLEQITAGQMVDSHCIDAGGDLAVSLGMFKYSTSTLGTPDAGTVDLGYHYPIVEYCRKWDLFVDNIIDFRDFAVFASVWVDDLSGTGYRVDDLKEFTYCWLEELAGDMNAPTPNPMTWAITPHALTGNSVGMTASTAVDASGQVYYQFEDANGTASAWQTDTYYVVTGLNPKGQYCFRVRARDKYNNATAWSEPACVSDIGDVNAPTPAPTFVAARRGLTRDDANTASGQYEWGPPGTYQLDWWHRVIVDVTGVADDITPTSELEVSFICSNSNYSSDTIIPAAYRPIRIGHPVSIGSTVVSNGYVTSGYQLTWDLSNSRVRIVYDVYVNAWGGSYGRQLDWTVCVYDASQNAACTATVTIPPSQ